MIYCIVHIENGEYHIGTFRKVINDVCRWYVNNGILHIKFNNHQVETYEGYTFDLLHDQIVTIIYNFIWNNLERFGYTKFQQTT